MTAEQVKSRLYSRHPGSAGQMPGPWTVIEEYRAIDLLAFSAWSSAERYARVGYEVKVSRSDLRAELLNPAKRAANVAWCNAFYLAVPKGLLTDEELAWQEPEWCDDDWIGERCPGFAGRQCHPRRHRKRYIVDLPQPTTARFDHGVRVDCPTCKGKGYVTESRVVREAPTCWVPRDVGLVVVDGRGSRLVRKSPRRAEVPPVESMELGRMVRWISMRPDPRHHPRPAAAALPLESVA